MKRSRFMAIVLASSLMMNGISLQAAEMGAYRFATDPAVRAKAREQVMRFRDFVIRNKGKIIASTAAALLVLIAAIGGAKAYSIKQEMMKELQKRKLDKKLEAKIQEYPNIFITLDWMATVAGIAKTLGYNGLKVFFRKHSNRIIFIDVQLFLPEFIDLLAEYAQVDREDIVQLRMK